MLFDQLKQLLTLAVTSTEFQAKNVIMQDATFSGLVSDHIDTLTPDFNIKLNSTNVSTTTGLLTNDVLNKKMTFTPKGTEKLALGYLERNIQNPTKIWVRTVTPTSRRYLITDATQGVLFVNDSGEITGSLPGFGLTTGYEDPTSAISFTVSATEYIAVAMPTHNAVRIFNATTFVVVSTIGVYDTPGLPGTNLDTPVDLAFDATTSTLYVCSDTGTAPTGTGAGYIASYDMTIPATPVFGDYIAVNAGGLLLHGQVNAPKNIFFDSTLNAVWTISHVATTPEIGAIVVEGLTSPGYLLGYIETRGSGFDITPSNFWLSSGKLYVTSTSSVEVFETTTFKHIRSYGQYTVEDTATNTSTDLDLDFGALSSIAVDTVSVDGVSVTTLVIGDTGNRRILRFSENTFDQNSYATFSSASFSVPVSLQGYVIQGNIPETDVAVEYKTSDTGSWQTLDKVDDVPGSLFLQFRVRVKLTSTSVVKDSYYIKQLIIIGKQE